MWTIAVQAQYNSTVINAHTLRDFILKSKKHFEGTPVFFINEKIELFCELKLNRRFL